MDELRAQARALANEEKNEQLIINHGNVAAFKDLLDPEKQDFFDSVEEIFEKKKKWLRLCERMSQKINEGNYEEALEIFEDLYREAEEF